MIHPYPQIKIAGRWIANHPVDGWESVVLAGMQLGYGGRASAADALPWPTATIKILATEVPEYLVVRPQGVPVEVWVQDGDTRERIFYGMADAPRIRAVRTKMEGHEFVFEVTMPVTSRAAALSAVVFSEFADGNDRVMERASTRLAWLNKVMTTKNSPFIRQEFHHLTPLFDAPSGALGGFPYWVAAKDYKRSSVVEAWSELAMVGAEFTEYLPAENRLSARGRVAVHDPFLRLGWVNGDRVGIVDNPTVPGTVLQSGAGEMAEATYSDVGTVGTVRVTKFSRWTGGTWDPGEKKWIYHDQQQGTVVTWPKNRRGLRRYEVSTIGLERTIHPTNPLGTPDGYNAAILRRFKDLVDDASNPTHPPIKMRFTDGFESWYHARVWLRPETYDPGPIYVAGSVFNLRRGASFHSLAGTSVTWEAYGTDMNQRRWSGTMQLTPVEGDPLADPVKIKDLNPSALVQTPASQQYASVPARVPISRFAPVTAVGLAAAVADSTSTAFTYEELAPTLRVDELRSVAEGL